MISTRKQSGFSLTEILIALALTVLIGAVMWPLVASLERYEQQLTTRSALSAWQSALTAQYIQDAWSIDSTAGAIVTFDAAGAYTLTSGNTLSALANPGSYQNGITLVAQSAGESPQKMALDGFNRPFVVFVSNQIQGSYDGYPLYYHVIALVSNDGGAYNASGQVLDPGTTFDPTTGRLTVGGHDLATIVNGFAIEHQLADRTLERMRALATQYSTLFETSYLANTTRSIAVDYFANSGATGNQNWDPASIINNTEGQAYTSPAGTASASNAEAVTTADPNNALGASPADETDAWGYPMGIENAGSVARNPSNPNGVMANPPYTAFIDDWFPGMVLVRATATGTY